MPLFSTPTRLTLGSQDDLYLSVYLVAADGSGPVTALANVRLGIINPDNTLLGQATDLFVEIDATNAAGVYELTVPVAQLTQFGIGQLIVDPNDVTVKTPEPASFERLSGIATSAPPAGNNLCTLADVQVMLVKATTAAQDSMINAIIPRISAWIHDNADRKYPSQTFTETHDGTGLDRIFLRNAPITSLTSVTLAGVAQDVTAFTFDAVTGELEYTEGTFLKAFQNIVVVYVGGYTTIPPMIVEIACEMTVHRFQTYQRRLVGVDSEVVGEGNRTYTQNDFLPRHKKAIELNRNEWGVSF